VQTGGEESHIFIAILLVAFCEYLIVNPVLVRKHKYMYCFRSTRTYLPHAVNCVRFCFWRSETFLFVHDVSREPLNGFVPNSLGRRIWSLARTNLNVKIKGQRVDLWCVANAARSCQ